MNYLERFDLKAAKLLTYFPKPAKSLRPFFEEVLFNASVKVADLENVLKFLKGIEDLKQHESVEALFTVIWPRSDKNIYRIGLSNEKKLRDDRKALLFSKLDAARKFVKVTNLTKWEISQISKFQKRLGLEILDVLNIISISPTLLRGLKKSPRPLYAWIFPAIIAMPTGLAMILLYPNVSMFVLWVLTMIFMIPGTYFVSTRLRIAPGILYYPKVQTFLKQVLQGGRRKSEIEQTMERLGVDSQAYQKHREYENPATGVRVVVRDKHQLEDAVKFLTSSEDIDNCIALRNFVSWTLPSLLADDGIVLADIYSKGSSKRYAHRGQMWMMAAEEAGEPVLVVNSFEFNDEGSKYTEILMPEAIKALQDIARQAGFKKIYAGITEFARQYLDHHYPQGQSKNTIKKIHSAREAGFKYQFDVFALKYSLNRSGLTREYLYQKKRSLTVRTYALIFGFIEFLKGNKSKRHSFWQSSTNPNNFWEIPLQEESARSEVRTQGEETGKPEAWTERTLIPESSAGPSGPAVFKVKWTSEGLTADSIGGGYLKRQEASLFLQPGRNYRGGNSIHVDAEGRPFILFFKPGQASILVALANDSDDFKTMEEALEKAKDFSPLSERSQVYAVVGGHQPFPDFKQLSRSFWQFSTMFELAVIRRQIKYYKKAVAARQHLTAQIHQAGFQVVSLFSEKVGRSTKFAVFPGSQTFYFSEDLWQPGFEGRGQLIAAQMTQMETEAVRLEKIIGVIPAEDLQRHAKVLEVLHRLRMNSHEVKRIGFMDDRPALAGIISKAFLGSGGQIYVEFEEGVRARWPIDQILSVDGWDKAAQENLWSQTVVLRANAADGFKTLGLSEAAIAGVSSRMRLREDLFLLAPWLSHRLPSKDRQLNRSSIADRHRLTEYGFLLPVQDVLPETGIFKLGLPLVLLQKLERYKKDYHNNRFLRIEHLVDDFQDHDGTPLWHGLTRSDWLTLMETFFAYGITVLGDRRFRPSLEFMQSSQAAVALLGREPMLAFKEGFDALAADDLASILDLPLGVLQLQPRIEQALFQLLKIDRLRDLTMLSRHEVSHTSGLSKKTYREIMSALGVFETKLREAAVRTQGKRVVPRFTQPGLVSVLVAELKASMPIRKMLMDAGFRTVGSLAEAAQNPSGLQFRLQQAGLWNTWALDEIQKALSALDASTQRSKVNVIEDAVALPSAPKVRMEMPRFEKIPSVLKTMKLYLLYQELMNAESVYRPAEVAVAILKKQQPRRVQIFTDEQNKMRYFTERLVGLSFREYEMSPKDLDAIYEKQFFEELLLAAGKKEGVSWTVKFPGLAQKFYLEWLGFLMPSHEGQARIVLKGLHQLLTEKVPRDAAPKLEWTAREVLERLQKDLKIQDEDLQGWRVSVLADAVRVEPFESGLHLKSAALAQFQQDQAQAAQYESVQRMMAELSYRHRQGLWAWSELGQEHAIPTREYKLLFDVSAARVHAMGPEAVDLLQSNSRIQAPTDGWLHQREGEARADVSSQTPVSLKPIGRLDLQPEQYRLSEKEEQQLTELIRSRFPDSRDRKILLRVLESRTLAQVEKEIGRSADHVRRVYERAVFFMRKIMMISRYAERGSEQYALRFMKDWLPQQDPALLLEQQEWIRLYRVSGGDTELLKELFLQAFPDLKPSHLEDAIRQVSFGVLHPDVPTPTMSSRRAGGGADGGATPEEVEQAVQFAMAKLGHLPQNRREGLQRRILRDLYYPAVLRDSRKQTGKTLEAIEALLNAENFMSLNPQRGQALRAVFDFYSEGSLLTPDFVKPAQAGVTPEPLRLDQILSAFEQKQHLERAPHGVLNAGQARTGKTAPSVLAMLNVRVEPDEKPVQRILYTTSKTAMYQVRDELERRLDTEKVKFFVMDGKNAAAWKAEIDAAAAADQAGFKVVLIGSYGRVARFENELRAFAPDGHILDEVENLRGGHHTARAPKIFGIPARYRTAISARFIVNRRRDLTQTLVWLLSGKGVVTAEEWKQAVLAFNQFSEEKILGILDVFMVRWRRHTVLPELTQPISKRINVPYSDLQRATIEAMRQDFPNWLKTQARWDLRNHKDSLLTRIQLERWASADLRLVLPPKVLKGLSLNVISPKTVTLQEILKREDAKKGKVLALYDFVGGIENLERDLNKDNDPGTALGLQSRLSLKARHEGIQKFRGEYSLKVLIGSHELLGASLNLFQLPDSPFHTATLVNMSEAWIPYDDGDRLIGPGQTHAVTAYTLVSTSPGIETVDEHLHDLVNRKRKLLVHTLDGTPKLTASARKSFEQLLPQKKSEVRSRLTSGTSRRSLSPTRAEVRSRLASGTSRRSLPPARAEALMHASDLRTGRSEVRAAGLQDTLKYSWHIDTKSSLRIWREGHVFIERIIRDEEALSYRAAEFRVFNQRTGEEHFIALTAKGSFHDPQGEIRRVDLKSGERIYLQLAYAYESYARVYIGAVRKDYADLKAFNENFYLPPMTEMRYDAEEGAQTVQQLMNHELPAAMETLKLLVVYRHLMDTHGAQDRPLLIWQNLRLGELYPFFTDVSKKRLGVYEIEFDPLKIWREQKQIPSAAKRARYLLLKYRSPSAGTVDHSEEKLLKESLGYLAETVRAPVVMIDHSPKDTSGAQNRFSNSGWSGNNQGSWGSVAMDPLYSYHTKEDFIKRLGRETFLVAYNPAKGRGSRMEGTPFLARRDVTDTPMPDYYVRIDGDDREISSLMREAYQQATDQYVQDNLGILDAEDPLSPDAERSEVRSRLASGTSRRSLPPASTDVPAHASDLGTGRSEVRTGEGWDDRRDLLNLKRGKTNGAVSAFASGFGQSGTRYKYRWPLQKEEWGFPYQLGSFVSAGYIRIATIINRKTPMATAILQGIGSSLKSFVAKAPVVKIWAKVIRLLAAKAHLGDRSELFSIENTLRQGLISGQSISGVIISQFIYNFSQNNRLSIARAEVRVGTDAPPHQTPAELDVHQVGVDTHVPTHAGNLRTGRSEVRVFSGKFFGDERPAYQAWEKDFEKARGLRGAVLQAAIEGQPLKILELVEQYGKSRKTVKKILTGYGFVASAGQKGVYGLGVYPMMQRRSAEPDVFLPPILGEFVQDDIVGAASELIVRQKRFVPGEFAVGTAYGARSNFLFWKAVSPKLSELFSPFGEQDQVSWKRLRWVVMDLWASIQVLQAIQRTPLNEYRGSVLTIPGENVLAQALSTAAQKSSEAQLFTKNDLPDLRQLQLDLERLHYHSAKILMTFEKSLSRRSEVRAAAGEAHAANSLAALAHPGHHARAALINFNDLETFGAAEIREAAIVMKQRSEVRFVIYNAGPNQEKLLHFKHLFSFRNVTWTQSGGEAAFQALGSQFKDGGVVGFSRGGQDSTGGFSLASRKKISRFKLSAKRPGTMAVALSFDPEDPRYRWGIFREGGFYIVADTLVSVAVNFLSQFVVAASA